MLTFLRRIRRSLFGTGSTGKYLLYAIGEIALVVMGILIALRINNWNEERKEAEVERQYMVGLLSDLAKDRDQLLNNVEFGLIPVMYNDSLFSELQKKPLRGREKKIYHFYLLYTNAIRISYHDRTISQLKNSGGFGLIKSQGVSDAILDYDVYMRESMEFSEGSRSNHHVNNDILLNSRMYEIYRIEHLKDSAIAHKDVMNKVAYPEDLRLLSYDDADIKIILNSMSKVRTVDQYNYHRAVEALEINRKLDSLIRNEYLDKE
ncbi:MAG: hypothetical protein HKN76_05170 [Saprospiraceae bacterium]|nr:hypothetical protein [Saprospiraceae bacterium]